MFVLAERLVDGVAVARAHVLVHDHAETLHLIGRGYRFPHFYGRMTETGAIEEIKPAPVVHPSWKFGPWVTRQP